MEHNIVYCVDSRSWAKTRKIPKKKNSSANNQQIHYYFCPMRKEREKKNGRQTAAKVSSGAKVEHMRAHWGASKKMPAKGFFFHSSLSSQAKQNKTKQTSVIHNMLQCLTHIFINGRPRLWCLLRAVPGHQLAQFASTHHTVSSLKTKWKRITIHR